MSDEKSDLPHAPHLVDPKIDVESRNAENPAQDVAMAMVGEHSHPIDPAVEARVIRKIDRFMIPAMIVGYGFVYYDKVSCNSMKPHKRKLTLSGHSRIRCALRNDQGPLS